MMIGPEHGPECVESCAEGVVAQNGTVMASIQNAYYVNDMTYKYVMLYTFCVSSCPAGMIPHYTTRKCLNTCSKIIIADAWPSAYCADADASDVGEELAAGDVSAAVDPSGYPFH